jgi:hypothetical protein
MLWQTSIAPQRLAPRGDVAMTCAGRPGYLSEPKQDGNPERWRS